MPGRLPAGWVSAPTCYLAVSYALLIVYEYLHSFTGWQFTGLPVFDYFVAPWPRDYRAEDLVVNVLGYNPLSFVLAPALIERCVLRQGRRGLVTPVLVLLLLGIADRTLASGSFFVSSDPGAWLTPGARNGLMLGLPLLLAALIQIR